MSPTEEPLPSNPAPDAVSPQTGDGVADAAAAQNEVTVPPADAAPDTSDTLSPAVRRLVRQFDLDITGIHGTGPSGRIRVGDVMGLLGGRKDTGKRDAPAREATPENDPAPPEDDAIRDVVVMDAEPQAAAEPAAHAVVPMTTVFDCDLSRVLAHRRKLRRDNVELLTTSYFLTALAAAIAKVPALAGGETPRFGVSLTTADGRLRGSVLEVPDTMPERPDERVRAVDVALRANLHTPLEHSSLLVHHYGESGSLLATPTPIGAGHVASIGIGRVRRELVVRVIDGVETPRVAACCHLSLSFFPDRVPLQDANRALAAAVAILESWPE
jgi:2-oxoglutarate dehydrogenase E2 component (dihydrolipoamide succinyltransferase)